MITVTDLVAGYPGRSILDHVSLSIPDGKITVILGPNGSGKSTLLKSICGILPITQGKIIVDGSDIAAMPGKTRAQKVTYLAQSRTIPDITVERLVLHGRFPYLSYPRRYRKEDFDAADRALAQMGISDLAVAPLTKLSGGQRQKAYLAMALAQDTPIILLDEPTTYLDIDHQLQMLAEVRRLQSTGKTVVMVLHDLSMAMQAADHLILMDQGCAVASGTPENIFEQHCIDKIFNISLNRLLTGSSWHYYCEASTPGAPDRR